MTMKLTLVFALGIASTAAIVPANAQTYQWKNSSGQTVISDTPPPRTTLAPRTIGGNQQPKLDEEKSTEKQADAPKTTAEKDLEFKKRQQEAKEKAEKSPRNKLPLQKNVKTANAHAEASLHWHRTNRWRRLMKRGNEQSWTLASVTLKWNAPNAS